MNAARNLLTLGLKGASKCCCRKALLQSVALRCMSATPAAIPQPDGQPKIYPPKIEKLVTEISGLTLLEVTDLSALLKERLNLPDAPAVSFAAGPVVAAQAAAGAAEAEEEKPGKSLKTVKMTGFDEKQKVTIIKFVRTLMEDMNLVQAKKFVESAPVVVKGDLLIEEAEKLKKELEAVGAKVIIE